MLGVNNNIGNYRAQDALSFNHAKLQVALERLSTGIRVNRAEDDASGLILRDRFQAQVGGLEEAIRNIQTAQGMIQVAEEGINKITDALQQMRQLAVRAADDNLQDKDRQDIQEQIKMLLKEINDRAEKTSYNGHKVLNGSITEAVEERRSRAMVQTNAFLRDGTELFSIGLQYATNATTYGAVCQGSYEVKLVYAPDRFEGATPSAFTTVGATGTPSGTAFLNSSGGEGTTVSTTQVVRDRAGIAHNMTITFTKTMPDNEWRYQISGAQSGTWTAAVNSTGTVLFDGTGLLSQVNGVPGATSTTLNIADGTAAGQTYTVNFAALRENDKLTTAASILATQSTGVNGTASDQITMAGSFGSAATIGDPFTVAVTGNVIDARGAAHAVTVIFTKFEDGGVSGLDDIWSYQVMTPVSPYWDGSGNNNLQGRVQFNAAGAAVNVWGQDSGATVAASFITVTVGDGGSNQQVRLDFAALNVAANTVAITATEDGTGAAGTETTGATLDGRVISGTTTFTISNFYRPGYDPTTVSVTMTLQPGGSNTWNVTVALTSGPAGAAFYNTVTDVTVATVTFENDGDATGNITLGMRETNTNILRNMVLDTAFLKMGRDSTLNNTLTDGSIGTGAAQVDALVYWTDGGSAPAIVSTMYDVSGSRVRYAAGGIILTVNTVSPYDAGLVGYAKTLTYVSATAEDNALQFQTGSDEGEVFRVGIQKMTVDMLFRRDYYRGEGGTNADGSPFDPGFPTPYSVGDGGSISIATTLQAQDLIGQIDDALQIAGRANLKVGAFKNEFDRTLDQQRANHTQMQNAFADINDADMAVEATIQSKRNILIQSGTAMVAQANQSSQFILQLLR